MKGTDMAHSQAQSDTPGPDRSARNRWMLMLLAGIYFAMLIATVLDAIYGQSLIAPWSLALVSWLWQLARCSALAGLFGAVVGLAILILGHGSFHTMTTGLSLAAFSVLYGVLIAMPAGCMVVLDGDD